MTQMMERPVAEDTEHDHVDVAATTRRARNAQARWSATPISDRLRLLKRLRHRIAHEGLSLAAEIDGSNRDLSQRLVGEVLPVADAIRFLERRAPRILRTVHWGRRGRPLWLSGARLEVRREPLGVVLVIGPSNYPLLLPAVQALQALAAGNAVLIKPAPGHGASIIKLREWAIEAGLDAELFGLLPEDESSVAAVVEAGIDKVFLTGSARTGKVILRALADHLVPAVMELSGCDAAFICPDADLDLAARALAFSLGFNGGATCIAPRRVFVPRELQLGLASRLLPLLKTVPAARLRAGDVARLNDLREDAVLRGARVVDGPPSPGRVPPMIVFDATPEMGLLQADLMAPVLSIVCVDDVAQAVSLNAHCPYALGATIFASKRSAEALAGRINAGVVLVNDAIVPHADPRLPFGGRGQSGFGVTRGTEGLLEMTRVKAVSIRGGKFRPHYDAPQSGDDELFADYLLATHGQRASDRIRATVRFVSRLIRRRPTQISGNNIEP